MRFLFRAIWWAAAAAAAASVGAMIVAYALASRSTPDYGATVRAEGLSGGVEILRDARATPHIFAQTPNDAYFALGFVHAQDRLWQMELRRRLAQGRLSELVGPLLGWIGLAVDVSDVEEALFRIDVTARAIDLEGAAAASLQSFGPAARAQLDAYAAGVNAFLGQVDADARGRGAPELMVLGARVAPWRALDSVVAYKLFAAGLTRSAQDELRRARLVIGVGWERFDDLFPSAPIAPSAPTEEDATDRSAPASAPALALGRMGDDAVRALAALGLEASTPLAFDARSADASGASNIWAVAGARSATRAPLLAADPHLSLTAPSLWYVARLGFGDDAEAGDAIGATLPGVPAILIGRNARVAWAAAALPGDVADIFIEQVNPDDPSLYRTPSGWRAFEERTVDIVRADGTVATTTLLASERGPVLPLDWPDIAAVTPVGHVATLAWTGLSRQDRSLEAAMGAARAPSLDALLALRPLHRAPLAMMAAADADSVAMYAIGRAPLRRPDSETRGRTPSPGWRARNHWVGLAPIDDGPFLRDPASGVLAYANNRVEPDAFARRLADDWPEPYRIRRLNRLLEGRDFHTLSGFAAIQSDAVSGAAQAIAPLMARPFWARIETEIGLRRVALEALADWNGDMDALRPEPLIFAAWARAATRRLAADELGGLWPIYEGVRPLFLEQVLRDRNGAAARWCDDVGDAPRQTCVDILSAALDDALAEIASTQGDDPAGWRWGRAHEAVHAHDLFRGTALSALFDIRQESSGGAHTILRGLYSGRGETPFRNEHAAGLRVVFDLADLDRSRFVLSTGQSGHFLSRHYDDFAPLWRIGETAPLSLARTDAEAGAVGITRLEPAEGSSER